MKTLRFALVSMLTFALALASPALAQTTDTSQAHLAIMSGTVVDVDNDPISGAAVVLRGVDLRDHRSVVTDNNGFYELRNVAPGVPYHIVISSSGFADWRSPEMTLEPGEYKIVTGSKLRFEPSGLQLQFRNDNALSSSWHIR